MFRPFPEYQVVNAAAEREVDHDNDQTSSGRPTRFNKHAVGAMIQHQQIRSTTFIHDMKAIAFVDRLANPDVPKIPRASDLVIDLPRQAVIDVLDDLLSATKAGSDKLSEIAEAIHGSGSGFFAEIDLINEHIAQEQGALATLKAGQGKRERFSYIDLRDRIRVLCLDGEQLAVWLSKISFRVRSWALEKNIADSEITARSWSQICTHSADRAKGRLRYLQSVSNRGHFTAATTQDVEVELQKHQTDLAFAIARLAKPGLEIEANTSSISGWVHEPLAALIDALDHLYDVECGEGAPLAFMRHRDYFEFTAFVRECVEWIDAGHAHGDIAGYNAAGLARFFQEIFDTMDDVVELLKQSRQCKPVL